MEKPAVFPVGKECTNFSYLEVYYENCRLYEIKFGSICVRMKYVPVFVFSFLISFLLLISKSWRNQFSTFVSCSSNLSSNAITYEPQVRR